MQPTKQITIGLEVYRIIEANRLSFAESENDILKRILIQKNETNGQNDQSVKASIDVKSVNTIRSDFFISSPAHKKDVYAVGKIITNGFLVLKGSKVSKEVTPKMPPYYRNLRDKLFNDGIISTQTRQFTKDYPFTAISAASSVILGVSSDGNRDWMPQIHAPELV